MSVTKFLDQRRERRTLADKLAELQDDLCPICGQLLVLSRLFLSVDHVRPRRGKKGQTGLYRNALATHTWCNSKKGDREPTGCELIWLEAINARLDQPAPPQRVAPLPKLADVWPDA